MKKGIQIVVGGKVWKPKEVDEKVAYIDMFYTREAKSWTLVKRTKEGFQIGDAIYTYHKTDAIKEKAELEKEYGIKNAKKKSTRKSN